MWAWDPSVHQEFLECGKTQLPPRFLREKPVAPSGKDNFPADFPSISKIVEYKPEVGSITIDKERRTWPPFSVWMVVLN